MTLRTLPVSAAGAANAQPPPSTVPRGLVGDRRSPPFRDSSALRAAEPSRAGTHTVRLHPRAVRSRVAARPAAGGGAEPARRRIWFGQNGRLSRCHRVGPTKIWPLVLDPMWWVDRTVWRSDEPDPVSLDKFRNRNGFRFQYAIDTQTMFSPKKILHSRIYT